MDEIMNLEELDFLPLRVMGVSPTGRRSYDPEGKRKLIAAWRGSGESVASLARIAGIKAKQLHNWIARAEALPAKASTPSVFVPVVEVGAGLRVNETPTAPSLPTAITVTAKTAAIRLMAQLPNGITVELHCAAGDAVVVTAMINALGAR
jgi:transposase